MSNLQMATWVVSQLVTDPLLPLAGLAVSVLALSTMAAANTTSQERIAQRQMEAKGEAIALEAKHTILFLAAASTGLLSMWMFPNILIYLSLLSFAVGSFFGMLGTLPNLLKKLGVPRQRAKKTGTAMACFLCVVWFVLRNTSYGWIFQNILGGFSITMMLTLFKPSTLSTPVLLLSAAFVYDVFFVFGTPYLTSSGESIMEAAATGAALTVNEAIPMLFRMPSRKEGEAVLGFGDVVLPGILVTFLRESDALLAQAYQTKLDKKQGSYCTTTAGLFMTGSPSLEGPVWSMLWSMVTTGWRRRHPPLSAIPSSSSTSTSSVATTWTYFAIAVTWFGIGLQVTFVAMMLSARGQPALLYLVPCTIVPVVYTAHRRGELWQLWHGFGDIDEPEESSCEGQELRQAQEQASPIDSFCNE